MTDSSFTITTSAFPVDGTIPEIHAHPSTGRGGRNVSPALAWHGVPAGTKSLAITCYDPDAPTGSGFWHWVAVNLSPEVTSLPEGVNAASLGFDEVANDYGEPGYGGPHPPAGETHRYVFTVHALALERVELPEGAPNSVARFSFWSSMLDSASVTGRYGLPAD